MTDNADLPRIILIGDSIVADSIVAGPDEDNRNPLVKWFTETFSPPKRAGDQGEDSDGIQPEISSYYKVENRSNASYTSATCHAQFPEIFGPKDTAEDTEAGASADSAKKVSTAPVSLVVICWGGSTCPREYENVLMKGTSDAMAEHSRTVEEFAETSRQALFDLLDKDSKYSVAHQALGVNVLWIVPPGVEDRPLEESGRNDSINSNKLAGYLNASFMVASDRYSSLQKVAGKMVSPSCEIANEKGAWLGLLRWDKASDVIRETIPDVRLTVDGIQPVAPSYATVTDAVEEMFNQIFARTGHNWDFGRLIAGKPTVHKKSSLISLSPRSPYRRFRGQAAEYQTPPPMGFVMTPAYQSTNPPRNRGETWVSEPSRIAKCLSDCLNADASADD